MSKSPTAINGEKKQAPIHPGGILLEYLRTEEIGINGLAQAIRVPANRISLTNFQNRFDPGSGGQAVIERDVLPKQAGVPGIRVVDPRAQALTVQRPGMVRIVCDRVATRGGSISIDAAGMFRQLAEDEAN